MNLFLHGTADFQVVRGDTLRQPAYFSGDNLATFDCVIANPPFSLEKWGEEVWTSDPYGRNFAGMPPGKSGDYAWVQHMIKSMAPATGRMAVVLPHGALFRKEEAEMRRKMIEADVIECVLGLGPNLFYNSPMEACVVICRTAKPKARKGRILFINAVNEVTRERAQSFLTDEHIERIVAAYRDYKDEPGFTRVAVLEEIRAKDGNLSIPLYVSQLPMAVCEESESYGREDSLTAALSGWIESSVQVRQALEALLDDNTSTKTRGGE